MRRNPETLAAAALLFGLTSFAAGAQPAEPTQPAQTQQKPKHHSLMKGAAAGAVGGHFVGKGHSKAGAAAGALYQHHQNKKEEKEAAKQQQ